MVLNAMAQKQAPVIVIHGGAGTILRSNITPEIEASYRKVLQESLNAGYSILIEGGKAEDAVVASIKIMEDSPLFNAGKGSVFTNKETIEMDAAIMLGKNRMAGAVTGVTTVKNPIEAARAVMEKSEHVLLTGKGADEFAEKNGVTIVDPSYFRDETRLRQLQKLKQMEKVALDHDSTDGGVNIPDSSAIEFNINIQGPDKKFGTVGCVVLDSYGNLAAGTSTGGMTNKKYGRTGDAPIIGAGTFADNATCAVSCTGHGEYYIRYTVAGDVHARMLYAGMSLQEAASSVIDDLLKIEGMGGLIAVDYKGNVAMPFNTPGMYRGVIQKDGKMEILIFKE
jgi:beta-aspartyl-peptidase (threonine type)